MTSRPLRRRRPFAGWKRPDSLDRNLIVIGGGAAGLVSSHTTADPRAKVSFLEAPQTRNADTDGLEPVAQMVPFCRVMARVHQVIAEIGPHDSVGRYRSPAVAVPQGCATLLSPRRGRDLLVKRFHAGRRG